MMALALLVLVGGMSWADKVMGSIPSPYMLDGSIIAYVSCPKSMGTAVYLGGGKYITAAHVVEETGCAIGKKPITVAQRDTKADWAIIIADYAPEYHAVLSCARLVEGQQYFSTGFAEGEPWPVTTRLIAESFRGEGESYLRGNIINGMSGGPISDQDGVVHAINDTRSDDGIPHSGVVELADTPLCKAQSI